MAKSSNRPEDAAKYKNIILSRYPNSLHAKILTDPDFVKRLEEEQKAIDRLYETTYQQYLNKNHALVLSNNRQAQAKYPEHELLPKFEYLAVLAQKPTLDDEQFRVLLKGYIEKFPNEGTSDIARRTLELMEESRPELVEKEETQIAIEIYKPALGQPHIAAFALTNLRMLTS
ncbi:MAG: hypothetical protein HC896_11420 [Bacteroidales bacterium]|nr:hypothetical protein [Bacteroidales bacterium]